MYLLEHDAEELLSRHNVHVPAGKLTTDADNVNEAAEDQGAHRACVTKRNGARCALC